MNKPNQTFPVTPGPGAGILLLIAGLLLAIMIGILTGCRSAQEMVRMETVEVLVPVKEPCPEPPEVARPVLPLAELDSTSAPADVLRAYVSSMWLLAGYAEELELLLGAYRPDTTRISE